MRSTTRVLLLTLTAALLGAAGCARTFSPAAGPQAGKSPVPAAAPRRIVSLAPNITEILYALGLQDRLVADTAQCTYPPEARRKPHIGDVSISVERVVSMKPDLVVAHAFLNRAPIQQLKGLYYFRDGIMDNNLVRMVVPHYNITYDVQECCGDEWANHFPYDLVNDENFLGEVPIPDVEEPIEDYVFSSSLDWDALITAGKFYLQSQANVSLHAPVNTTAWWWLEVGTHSYNGTELRIIQKARQQDTVGYALVRIYSNGLWSDWSHNYAQFAG